MPYEWCKLLVARARAGYIGSVLATLYAALFMRSYILSLLCSGLQVGKPPRPVAHCMLGDWLHPSGGESIWGGRIGKARAGRPARLLSKAYIVVLALLSLGAEDLDI